MSTKKSRVALATVKLRSTFKENQQKFSDRVGVALATLARWEIDNRQPSPRYLKELWHLAAEQDRADLAQVFADAFAIAAGYALSGGAEGFDVRRLIAAIRRNAIFALTEKGLGYVENIQRDADELDRLIRSMDLEPPFRSIMRFTPRKGNQ
jgi:hypothetical protein